MTTARFQELLAGAEGETLDFKQDLYDIPSDRTALNKDILAMSNTPRDDAAHIVFGVRWAPESGSTVLGVNRQLDDAQLQDAFRQTKIHPLPRFTYTPFEFEGRQVGVLEIPANDDGPFTPLVDCDGLQAGAIYYRRGSQNARATGLEVKRIVTWFSNRNSSAGADSPNQGWLRFLQSVRRFEADTTFLLVSDPVFAPTAPLSALGLPPWRAVIDFDPDSDRAGLLSYVAATLERRRVIHQVVKHQYHVQPEPGTHWFFARGLSGIKDTVSHDNDHRAWLKAYKAELGRQLAALSATVSPSPVVALVLWNNVHLRKHLRTLLEELHGAFGNELAIVVVSNDPSSFEAYVEDGGAQFLQMSLRDLCNGLSVHYADLTDSSHDRHILPCHSGAPLEIEHKTWLWLSEGLDLLHRSIGIDGDADARPYRLGADISWRNLHLHHDCDRDITAMIRSQVETDLRRRQTVRINIYHSPGSGGTTVGRRVAWDLHGSFPTGVLRKAAPLDAETRITKVAALTESSVLVVVDGEQHSDREIDDLFDLLKARHTPVVLLQILRRFHTQASGRRQFWLDAQLTDTEAAGFRDAYTRAAPAKTQLITQLAAMSHDRRRSAFLFGLTAFERDFRGLTVVCWRQNSDAHGRTAACIGLCFHRTLLRPAGDTDPSLCVYSRPFPVNSVAPARSVSSRRRTSSQSS